MAKYLLFVFSKPVAGQEAAYHEWYDSTHLADVITVAGFKAATRYSPEPMTTGAATSSEYLAIYEIEADDAAAAMAVLTEASARMYISPALDMQSIRMEMHKLITPRLERA